MRVHLTDPANTDGLVQHLRRCECSVQVVAPGVLDVDVRALPIDPKLRQPEVELDSYLRLWAALGKGEAWLVAA